MFRSTAFQYHENHWPEDVFTRAKQNVSKKAVPSFNQKLLSQSALRPPSFLFFLKAMSQHSTLVIYLLKKESVPSFHYHMVHLCLCNKIALVYGPSSGYCYSCWLAIFPKELGFPLKVMTYVYYSSTRWWATQVSPSPQICSFLQKSAVKSNPIVVLVKRGTQIRNSIENSVGYSTWLLWLDYQYCRFYGQCSKSRIAQRDRGIDAIYEAIIQ